MHSIDKNKSNMSWVYRLVCCRCCFRSLVNVRVDILYVCACAHCTVINWCRLFAFLNLHLSVRKLEMTMMEQKTQKWEDRKETSELTFDSNIEIGLSLNVNSLSDSTHFVVWIRPTLICNANKLLITSMLSIKIISYHTFTSLHAYSRDSISLSFVCLF